jgi:hypothetical protein
VGDRVYATPVGVAHVHRAHADLVVRLNRQSLPLFDLTQAKPLNVLGLFRQLKVDTAGGFGVGPDALSGYLE